MLYSICKNADYCSSSKESPGCDSISIASPGCDIVGIITFTIKVNDCHLTVYT